MDRETILAKAQKAFNLAGENPKTPEELNAYEKGRALLRKLAAQESGEAVRGVYLPEPKKADKRPFWASWTARTQVIPWKEFFTVEKNKMVVYRIVPHANVTNNNKRLWKAIYKVFELCESPASRFSRDGWKITYREKDYLWFDVIFRQEAGQRKIEFYLATSEYQAEKLKRKIENKIQATITPAELDALQVPEENTIVQELRYINHDIFSMNTNTQEHKTPIGAILATVDELAHDGDMARLSICCEAENRQRWVKSASWAYEKLGKGKVPQRAAMNGRRVAAGGKTLLGGILNEINDLVTDTLQAVVSTFFKSDKTFAKEKAVQKPFSLLDEINSRHVSKETVGKINQPVFKTRIRSAAHSADKLTRETISETLGGAYSEVSENNELNAIRVRIGSREIIRELNTLSLSARTKTDPNVNRISTDELAKLALQLPPADLQRKYDEALSVNRKLETDIPAALRESGGIYLGESEIKDKRIPVYMPLKNPDEFYRGYVFIGGQGAGKDTTIKNFVVDGCLNHGIAAIIPEVIVEEGERGMADGIRDSLPPDKLIDIDLADPDYIVPMDLTEVIAKLGRTGSSRFADEVCNFFGDMESMARSKRYLRTAAKASGGSLFAIKQIIEDEAFRLDTIERLEREGNIRLAVELTSWGDNESLGSKADPILNRLGDFFDNDTLYDIFAQPPKKEVDFARWMQEGKVIIIRIPSRKIGELAAKTLVHWITLKTFMTRLLMTKKQQENGCFMVFNEPEQYASEGLTKLMGRIGTEGRKERMGSLYAFHHWNKLPQSLQENLQGGGVQQFLYMNDHKRTFELSEHRLAPTITVEEATKIPAHHAIISVRAGGELQHAFICHMAGPVSKRYPQYDNSFITRRHSRMFGRSWADLQKGIATG